MHKAQSPCDSDGDDIGQTYRDGRPTALSAQGVELLYFPRLAWFRGDGLGAMTLKASLHSQERFFKIPSRKIGNSDGKTDCYREEKNHEGEVSGDVRQVREEASHHVVFQVKDEHMDEVKAITNLPEEL